MVFFGRVKRAYNCLCYPTKTTAETDEVHKSIVWGKQIKLERDLNLRPTGWVNIIAF